MPAKKINKIQAVKLKRVLDLSDPYVFVAGLRKSNWAETPPGVSGLKGGKINYRYCRSPRATESCGPERLCGRSLHRIAL